MYILILAPCGKAVVILSIQSPEWPFEWALLFSNWPSGTVRVLNFWISKGPVSVRDDGPVGPPGGSNQYP